MNLFSVRFFQCEGPSLAELYPQTYGKGKYLVKADIPLARMTDETITLPIIYLSIPSATS